MKPSANDFLKVYLGADDAGGFQPIGCEERLKSKLDLVQEEELFASTNQSSQQPPARANCGPG